MSLLQTLRDDKLPQKLAASNIARFSVEWTGLELGKSQRAVENRENWRKLVAKSFVVPQRPPRLRD